MQIPNRGLNQKDIVELVEFCQLTDPQKERSCLQLTSLFGDESSLRLPGCLVGIQLSSGRHIRESILFRRKGAGEVSV